MNIEEVNKLQNPLQWRLTRCDNLACRALKVLARPAGLEPATPLLRSRFLPDT